MADLAHLADPNRTIEALAGSDTLFSRLGGLNGDPAAAALAALPPLDLGSLTNIGDASGALPVIGDLGGVSDTLDLSSLLGSTSLGGGLPLDGLALGGLTNGGVASIVDTVTGALHLGDAAPGASVLGGVAEILGGDPVGGATDAIGTAVSAVGHVGSGAAMAVGQLGNASDQPIGDTLNHVIDTFHTGLANAAPETGIPGTIYGVVKVGTTIGLGDIGGDNLLTDVVDLIGGGNPVNGLGGIVDHAGALVPAVTGVVNGVVYDVEHALGALGGGGQAPGGVLNNLTGVLAGGDPATGVTNAVGNVGETVGDLAGGVTSAVDRLIDGIGDSPTDALNSAIDGFHNGLAAAAPDTGIPSTIYGVVKVGTTIGLGDIGGDNVLTDVVGLTGLVDGGNPTDALGGIVDHTTAILPKVEGVVDGLVHDIGVATGGSLPLPGQIGGADSLVGTLQEAIHLPGGGLPEPIASLVGGDLGGLDDLGGLGGLGGLTDGLHLGTPEHHGGGLGLGLV